MSFPKYTHFRPRIRSRHPSHDVLRPIHRKLPLLPFKSVVRLGSTTTFDKDKLYNRISVNTPEGIKNSSSKLLMKQCFAEAEVQTADWWHIVDADGLVAYSKMTNSDFINLEDLPFPIISKSFYGSRNKGNKKHENVDELRAWLQGKKLSNYIFEKYYNYTREYRLHITEGGCFYACRKMLKRDTPEEAKWYRNDEHCVWVMEDNELFDKPVNWDKIVSECVKALKAVKLDIGAVDLRIRSANHPCGKPRKDPGFIIVEINSAPSFGDVTEEKYLEEIPKILNRKFELTKTT